MMPKFLRNINLRNRISKWWSNSGNKGMPSWYFNGLFTFLFSYLMYFPIAIVGYAGMASILGVFFAENLFSIPSLLNLLLFTSIIVPIFGVYYLFLLHLRKRVAFTFKTKIKLRSTILKRHRFSTLFFYTSIVFVISAIIIFGIFLQLEYLNFIPTYAEIDIVKQMIAFYRPIFQEYFPFALTYFIFFYLLSVFTDIGLTPKEQLIYIVHSLEKFKNNKREKNKEKLEEDEYLVSKFVTTFDKTLLNSMRAIDEVDLSSKLSNIILARYMGTDEEKEWVKSSLSELRGLLKHKKWESQVFEWLKSLENLFPRFNNFKNNILISSKSSKSRTKIRDNILFIVAIGALLVAVIELTLLIIHY